MRRKVLPACLETGDDSREFYFVLFFFPFFFFTGDDSREFCFVFFFGDGKTFYFTKMHYGIIYMREAFVMSQM